MQNNLIIITARSASKGLYKKNIYPLLGKPLITYCFDAVKNSGVKNIIVSTDDANIKSICDDYNIRYINRSTEISLSDTTSIDVILDVINHIDFEPENIVLIQPTTPLIEPSDILEAINLLKNKYDSVISVYKSHIKLWEKSEDNYIFPLNHDNKKRINRQESTPVYIETGSIYATKFEKLIFTRQLLSGNIGYIDIPKIRSFEIDSYEDIQILESILSYEKSFFNI